MKMKKAIALCLAALMSTALFIGCDDETTDDPGNDNGATQGDNGNDNPSEGKTVFNLWAFTDEIPDAVMKNLMPLVPELDAKYEIKKTVIATTEGAYQPALDAALAGGGADMPDIYLAEDAFVMKYTQGDASGYAAAYKDLLPDLDAKLAESRTAQYMQDIGTRNGDLVSLAFQNTGGGFIYRRQMAIDIWGTDDPTEVAAKVGPGWDKFLAACEEVKAAGAVMLSGPGDLWQVYNGMINDPWVIDGKLVIDQARLDFLDQAKLFYDNGYFNDSPAWNDPWASDMKNEGPKPVLAFMGPAWLANYAMKERAPETSGDWGLAESPVPFSWGGTYVLANKDTTKKDMAAAIIDWVTLDTSETGFQYGFANGLFNSDGTKDAVASAAVMEKSDGSAEWFGGQNMFDIYIPAGLNAKATNKSQYDESLNSWWQQQADQYKQGAITKDQAVEAFKTQVRDNLDVTVE